MTAGMVRLMRAQGFGVTCIDTGGNGATGIRYHRNRIVRHLEAIRASLRPANKLVYIGGSGGLGLLYQSVVVLAARLRAAPILFHHHSGRYMNKNYLPAVALRVVCGGRVEHVVLSELMETGIRASFPRSEKIHIWSNACHVEPGGRTATAQSPSEQASRRPILFGHLSNLSLEKGLVDVIDVLRVATEIGIHATLTMGGPLAGTQEAELVQRAKADFGDRFSYQGPLDPEQIQKFMAPLDVFLFPTRYVHEAEPLVVLEAAAAGVPTIAAGNPSVRDLVEALAGEVIDLAEEFGTVAPRIAADMVGTERREQVRSAFTNRRNHAAAQVAFYLANLP